VRMVGVTAMSVCTERPRSPWMASQANRAYWTGSGWSRSYWWLIAASACGVRSLSAVRATAGPPGKSRSATNTTTLAAATTTSAAPNRRRRYQSIGGRSAGVAGEGHPGDSVGEVLDAGDLLGDRHVVHLVVDVDQRVVLVQQPDQLAVELLAPALAADRASLVEQLVDLRGGRPRRVQRSLGVPELIDVLVGVDAARPAGHVRLVVPGVRLVARAHEPLGLSAHVEADLLHHRLDD